MKYTGTINNNGNEAQGKWTSSGDYSGSWEMVKVKEATETSQPKDSSLTRSDRLFTQTVPVDSGKKQKGQLKATRASPRAVDVPAAQISRETINASTRVMGVELLRKKARELARKGKWSEVVILAEQVVNKSPGTLKDRRFLGLCLLSASQYQRGIHELEMVLKYGPADVVVVHHLGHAYYKVGIL